MHDIAWSEEPYISLDASVEALLSDQADDAVKGAHWRAIEGKGSLRMVTMLERHVEALSSISSPPARTSYGLPGDGCLAAARLPALIVKTHQERFGALPQNVEQRIASAEAEQLDALIKRAVTVESLDAL